MSVAGVEGPDSSRAMGTTTSTSSVSPTHGPRPPSRVTPTEAPLPRGNSRFENPELTSGLLSDNITPVQREGLGRLSRLLRMTPRDLLDSLRGGTGLGMLLTARRLLPSALTGMFDKGLLIDAKA
ncbi:MAG: hypothetical protein Q4G43_13985 [Mobilicoccus sp.]|nr:hypothetical protein [Mobilicoccus sp.]